MKKQKKTLQRYIATTHGTPIPCRVFSILIRPCFSRQKLLTQITHYGAVAVHPERRYQSVCAYFFFSEVGFSVGNEKILNIDLPLCA